jgi:hypothetical protein
MISGVHGMNISKPYGAVAVIVCLLILAVIGYGLYTDCPDTVGYVFCDKHQSTRP